MKEKETKNISQEKHDRKKALLILSAILLPLSLLLYTAYSHEKQRISEILNLKEQDLLESVSKALQSLNLHLQQSKVFLSHDYTWERSIEQELNQQSNSRQSLFYKSTQKLKHKQHKFRYFTFNSLQNVQTQNPNPLAISLFEPHQNQQIQQIQNHHLKKNTISQIFDQVVFSIVFFQLAPKNHPLSDQLVEFLQKSIKNQLQKRSYIKKLVSLSDQNTFDQNFQIQIALKSGHISEIDQNQRKKVQEIFNYKKPIQNDRNEQRRQNEEIQFYLEQVFRQLEELNRGNQCRFWRNYTECRQFQVYFLYDDLSSLTELIEGDQNLQMTMDEEQSIKSMVDKRTRDMGYWSRQDNSMSIITFYPLTNKSQQMVSLGQMNLKLLFSLIEETIYENLGISPFVLLTQDMWHWNYNEVQRESKIQQLIDHYFQVNLLYKVKHYLQYLKKILNTTQSSPLYEKINHQTKINIFEFTPKIINYVPFSQTLIKNSILISHPNQSPLLTQITYFDPFPSDYILGALLPIAIILLYPLFIFIKKFLF